MYTQSLPGVGACAPPKAFMTSLMEIRSLVSPSDPSAGVKDERLLRAFTDDAGDLLDVVVPAVDVGEPRNLTHRVPRNA